MNGISLPPSASPSVSSLWSTFYTQSPLFSNDLPTALHARRNQRRQYLDNDYDGVVGKGGGGDSRQGMFAREYLSQPPPITKTLPLQQPVPCMEHKKPVLVVGATGRVGRRVVQQLLTQVRRESAQRQ